MPVEYRELSGNIYSGNHYAPTVRLCDPNRGVKHRVLIN